MQRHHRSRHRWIWMLLLPALIAALVVSLRARPRFESSKPVPTAQER